MLQGRQINGLTLRSDPRQCGGVSENSKMRYSKTKEFICTYGKCSMISAQYTQQISTSIAAEVLLLYRHSSCFYFCDYFCSYTIAVTRHVNQLPHCSHSARTLVPSTHPGKLEIRQISAQFQCHGRSITHKKQFPKTYILKLAGFVTPLKEK